MIQENVPICRINKYSDTEKDVYMESTDYLNSSFL